MAQAKFDKQVEETADLLVRGIGRVLDGVTRTDATFWRSGTRVPAEDGGKGTAPLLEARVAATVLSGANEKIAQVDAQDARRRQAVQLDMPTLPHVVSREIFVTPQEIEALAMTAATTIVAAMATDAWDTARNRVVGLFHRRSPDLQAQVEAQLDANAALVSQDQDAERSRRALIGLWQLELERLLRVHPEAVGDLSAQVAEIQSVLPVAQQQWAQHNTARDHGVVNAVQHGIQHVHYMDAQQDRRSMTPAPDDNTD